MEFLKPNPIIDPNYKPSLEMSYLDYFNRALVFAQTNYQDQIQKVSNTHFRKLAPTTFFEEYAWCITCLKEDLLEVSQFFPDLVKSLFPLYQSFWDLNNFPKAEDIKERIVSINNNERKFQALYGCASIINQGIKLFGWDRYRDNFLEAPAKLAMLPMIGMQGAKQLSRNVGVSSEIISTAKLHKAAGRWGFEDSQSLCAAIQKYVPMQLKVIELILWYSITTFEDNIPEA